MQSAEQYVQHMPVCDFQPVACGLCIERVGDYGSLLGGIIHQLAVTPPGQGPTQSVPRPSRSEAIRLPARPHLSLDDGPVAGLINRPIFVHIIRPLLFSVPH